MADAKISELPAVVTPAAADQFAVNQGGVSRMETRAQIHTLESGERFIAALGQGQTTPSFGWTDDSGFFNFNGASVNLSIGGTNRWIMASDVRGSTGGSAAIRGATQSSNTVPTILPTGLGDADTGIGGDAITLDVLAMIAGGVSGLILSEVSSAILQAVNSNVGLTADPSSVQGGGVILSSYNVYATVATIGDAATLPAAFLLGTKVWVKNDAANSMDVFPALGDDAGAGVNVAVAVAGGATALFIATVVDSTWSQLI